MTRLAALLIPTLVAGSALAAETRLSGGEITALLPEITAKTYDTFQTFSEDGSTNYRASGRPSTGRWRVEDNRYCSTWNTGGTPIWTCYEVLRDGDMLIWVDPNGERTVNTIEHK